MTNAVAVAHTRRSVLRVVVKQVTGLGITAVGVFVTVSASLPIARRENLASLYAA